MSKPIKVQTISDQDYVKYKHFIRDLKESNNDYDGIVVVKSFRLNKRTEQYQEYVISMTY